VVRDTPAGLLYAVVYTSQERNGRLVVARLGPSALANVTGEPPIQDDDAAARGGESGIEEAGSAASPAAAPSGDAGGDGGEGGAGDAGSSPGTGWALLQAHSREVEIVDLALSGRHLAVLERRNGTLAATAYTLPADGAPRRAVGCLVKRAACRPRWPQPGGQGAPHPRSHGIVTARRRLAAGGFARRAALWLRRPLLLAAAGRAGPLCLPPAARALLLPRAAPQHL
jgi:hypothetical protein